MAGSLDHLGHRAEQRADDDTAEHHAHGPADDRAAGQAGHEGERAGEEAPCAAAPVADGDDAGAEVAPVEHSQPAGDPHDEGEHPEEEQPRLVRPVGLDAARPAQRRQPAQAVHEGARVLGVGDRS